MTTRWCPYPLRIQSKQAWPVPLTLPSISIGSKRKTWDSCKRKKAKKVISWYGPHRETSTPLSSPIGNTSPNCIISYPWNNAWETLCNIPPIAPQHMIPSWKPRLTKMNGLHFYVPNCYKRNHQPTAVRVKKASGSNSCNGCTRIIMPIWFMNWRTVPLFPIRLDNSNCQRSWAPLNVKPPIRNCPSLLYSNSKYPNKSVQVVQFVLWWSIPSLPWIQGNAYK